MTIFPFCQLSFHLEHVFPEGNMGNKPLTIRETAEALNLSQPTIRAWVARRKIGVIRLGRAIRIPNTEIQRLLTENAVPARSAR
jgi:excisionase family DNA binding protein